MVLRSKQRRSNPLQTPYKSSYKSVAFVRVQIYDLQGIGSAKDRSAMVVKQPF